MKSMFYPDTPHPIAMLHTHPKFISLSRAPQIPGREADADLFYALDELRKRVAADPESYIDGIDLQDFLEACANNRDGERLVEELRRMNVYHLLHDPERGSRLMPVVAIEAATAARSKRVTSAYSMLADVTAATKAEAARRGISVSRFVELALLAYLGNAEPY